MTNITDGTSDKIISKEIKISDSIQKRYNFEQFSIIGDIILAIIIYFTYLYLPTSEFTRLLKFYIILVLIRYFFSNLTKITINDKKYFQVSSHMTLFLLIVLIGNENQIFGSNEYINLISYFAVIIYGSLLVILRTQYSVDVINSIFLTTFIYNSRLI